MRGLDRNRLARQSIGITGAIVTLMVVQDDVSYPAQQWHLKQQVVADPRVRADQLAFRLEERRRFVEHAVAHADVADIAQQRRVVDEALLVWR